MPIRFRIEFAGKSCCRLGVRSIRSFLLATVFLPASSLLAEDTGGGQVTFGDKLSMLVLPGWKAVSRTTGEAALTDLRPPSEIQTLGVLLSARPADSERTASFVILKDASFRRLMGPVAKAEAIARTNDLAASQGFEVVDFVVNDASDNSGSVLVAEATGKDGHDHRRKFVTVFLKSFAPPFSVRCVWQ
jgi:hypothetical protein